MLLCQPITEGAAQEIAAWRRTVRESLRTTEMASEWAQAQWWRRLQQPGCRDKYWEVRDKDVLVACVGLTGISFENGNAEISLIVAPEQRGKGVGKHVVHWVLTEAFQRMRLNAVYGECYYTNHKSVEFWLQQLTEREADDAVYLPQRKYWNGEYYGSFYFTFLREERMSK